MAAHDFAKIYLTQSSLSYNTDTMLLSGFFKFFLIFLIETNDPNIDISRYNSLRPDHLSNTKRGGVCMFYKNYLLDVMICVL